MGTTLLGHTLSRFDLPACIDEVIVPTTRERVDHVRAACAAALTGVPWRVVVGGDDRNGSVGSAVDALDDPDARVLVHDGVRPLVSSALIQRVLEALEGNDAVVPVVASSDRVVAVAEGRVTGFPTGMVRGQSPGGFRLRDLRAALAHHRAAGEPAMVTVFELVLAWRPTTCIATVPGEWANLKVTVPEDLVLTEFLAGLDALSVAVTSGAPGPGADAAAPTAPTP